MALGIEPRQLVLVAGAGAVHQCAVQRCGEVRQVEQSANVLSHWYSFANHLETIDIERLSKQIPFANIEEMPGPAGLIGRDECDLEGSVENLFDRLVFGSLLERRCVDRSPELVARARSDDIHEVFSVGQECWKEVV